jgi:MerR family transcriptional regulator/heat shock protein HspR
LGINLAGVEVVLNMRQKIERIETEVNEFLGFVRKEFFEGREDEFEYRKRAIIKMGPAKIVKIVRENKDQE